MAAELHNSKPSSKQFSFQEKVDKIIEMPSLSDGSHADMNPHCFAALVNPNILTHHEAMKADNKQSFHEAY